MANSILKLNVESSEYDAKLKKAAEGVRHLADVAHKSAGDMTGLEQSTLDYIKSIGEMETKSRSAAGQARELESTYKELKVIYNQLNDVEKADEGGKALAASLEQLKQRAQDAKKSLDDASKSLQVNEDASKQDSSSISDLTSKLGINIESLVGWGAALAASKVALDVLKDAFFSSESNIDDWGRTIKAPEGAYDEFLQTINNGNWQNFFSNLSSAIQGARDLYDALDRLGSIKSNNKAAIAIVQQQVQQLRLLKQQGQNVDAQLKAATDRLAQLQKQSVDAGKTAGSKMIGETIRNGYQSYTGAGKLSGGSVNNAVNDIIKNGQKAFDKYAKLAADLEKKGTATRETNYGGSDVKYKVFDINNLTKEEQKQYRLAKTITERETEIQKGIELYAQAVNEGAAAAREELKGNKYAMAGSGKRTPKGTEKSATNKIEETLPEGSMADLQKKMKELQKEQSLVTDPTEWQIYASLIADVTKKMDELQGKTKQAVPDMTLSKSAEAELNFTMGPLNLDTINTYIGSIKSAIKDADLGSELYNSLTEKMKDASMFSSVLQQAIASGASGADLTAAADEMKKKLLEGDINDDTWQEFIDKLNEKIENEDLKLTFDVDTKNIETVAKKQQKDAQAMAKDWQAAGTAIQSVGQAMSQIEDPAAKVLGTIAQAVATMALSYSQAAASPAVTSTGWGWIAFAATGVATMLSSIQAIKNATAGFAEGGIIPGNSYSGDNMRGITPDGKVYGLNAGEVVLSASQQNNLAQNLRGAGMGNFTLETRVSGRDLVIVMNNDGTARGRGELVRTNRRS